MNKSLNTSLILLCSFWSSVLTRGAQPFETHWNQDSIHAQKGDSVLVLSYGFVVLGTEQILADEGIVHHYRVESIPGRIILTHPPDTSRRYVVTYEHFSKPFQTQFGPTLLSLPRLEDSTQWKTPDHRVYHQANMDAHLPFVSDGTIFRGISLSPSSGLSMNGGLRLTLQGQLSEDVIVTGTLSDQDLPILPEGNTQSLDEIDKVYLEVKHTSSRIVAGDIDMKMRHGQFLNLRRRLQGLDVQLTGRRSSAEAFVGSTKGRFHRLEFKGEDQNQGPYPLFSETGSRSMMVMASSERVWLDGEEMERGDNNDYTIDYSHGEITFTPNKPIDSNSRIYVEFEYSDLVYPRQIASTTMKRMFGDRGSYASLAWIHESDKTNSPLTGAADKDDRLGLKEFRAPESHQMFNAAGGFHLGDSTHAYVNVAGSVRDQNLLSDLNDEDNLGYAGMVKIVHGQRLPPGMGHVKMSVSNRLMDDRFSTLQRDKRVEFHREWNLVHETPSLQKDGGISQSISEIEIQHTLPQRSKTTISVGEYRDKLQRSTRWQETTSLTFHWVPEIDLEFTGVSRENPSPASISGVQEGPSRSRWHRKRFSVRFLPGNFHPYIRHEDEERTRDFKFYETGGGLMAEGQKVRANIGLTQRVDFDSNVAASRWNRGSQSWLGEVGLRGRWKSGYRVNLVFKQKVKSYADQNRDLNYGLARGSLGYNPRRGALRANADFKLEQTLFQHRMVVYDSVGAGLGNHRYDPDYDQYFPDPNGHFLPLRVPSGKKVPSSHLKAGLRLFYDFRNTSNPWIRDVTWRLYGNTDYNGSVLELDRILRPSLEVRGTNQSRMSLQQDLNYLPGKKRRRIRISTQRRHEFQHQDGRESLHTQRQKRSLSVEEPMSPTVLLVAEAGVTANRVKSTVISRERDVSGWLLSSGLRWKPSSVLEAGGDLRYGRDRGRNTYEHFALRLKGAGAHILLFPRNGSRLHASIDFYTVASANPLTVSLPPEATLGMQIGETYRAALTALFMLGRNLSAHANMTYTIDPINHGMINVSGEVRATF